MARFDFDPEFDANIHKASNKTGSSLRPLFDAVRQVTDEIYMDARESIAREAGRAQGEVESIRSGRFSRSGRGKFAAAKAKAFALKSAKNSVFPSMEFDGREIYGRVAIYRKDSASLEFGGIDSVAEIGRGTGEYVQHPAYSFLRRAMDGRSG